MKRKVPGMGIRNGQGSCAAGGETQMEESVKRRAGKRNGGARRTGRLLSCAALLMILTGAAMLSVGLFRITAQMMGAVDAFRISPLLYDLAACGMSADGLLLMRTGRKTLIDPFGEDRMVLGFPWSAWLVAFTAAAQAAGHMYVIEIRANIRVHHIATALELILLTAFYLLKDGAGRSETGLAGPLSGRAEKKRKARIIRQNGRRNETAPFRIKKRRA